MRSGTPSTCSAAVSSNGPMTKATRYVDIFMVGAKLTVRWPLPRSVFEVTGELEYAARWLGTVRLTWNVALKDGSSQQGKARRASECSNCVVAIMCETPSTSVNVER